MPPQKNFKFSCYLKLFSGQLAKLANSPVCQREVQLLQFLGLANNIAVLSKILPP